MRIMLKFVIDVDADAAWHALHSPAVLGEIYGPLITLERLSPDDSPETAHPSYAVQMRLFDVIPLGRQLIALSDGIRDDRTGSVRIVRDSGIPLTGPLSTLDVWDHQMAVSPVSGDRRRTLWRDRLVIAGPLAPVLWPMLWVVWQWRQRRIRRIAPSWADD